MTTGVQRWEYKPRWLVVSYTVAGALVFVTVGVGLHAISRNGYSGDTDFSTFLATTRNPELDGLLVGYSLGIWPLSKEVRRTRLKFGELVHSEGADAGNGQGDAHASFGFPDTVRDLVRGKKYV